MTGPGPVLQDRIKQLYHYRDQVMQDQREGVPAADTHASLRQLGFQSVQDLEQRINALSRSLPGRGERAWNALSAFGTGGEQGLSMGFSDELEGHGMWPQGADAGPDPTRAARVRLRAAQHDHPFAEPFGEVAGAMVPALATGMGMGALQKLGLSGLLARMFAGGAVGAAEGELGGIGRAEGDLPDRIHDTGVLPATAGAGIGMSLPPVAATAEAVMDPHLPVPAPTAARRMARAVPTATMDAAPDELAGLQRAVGQSAPVGPLAAGPMVAADTRAGQALTRGAAYGDPAGAGQTLAPLAERGGQAAPIMERVISAATGQAQRQSTHELEAAQQTLRSQVRTMYQGLEQYQPPNPAAYRRRGMDLVRSLADMSEFPRVWKQAQRVATNMGVKLQPIVTTTRRGVSVTGYPPDFITLQTIHEYLRDIVSQGFKSGASAEQRSTARSLSGRLDGLTQGMRDMFGGDYEAAQSAWRNARAATDAPRRSAALWSRATNVRDAANWVNSVGPDAQAVHRQGAIEDLIFRLSNSRNPVGFWRTLPDAKKALVFKPDELGQIDQAVGSLQRMRQTGQILGGSQTKANDAIVDAMGLGGGSQRSRTVLGTIWDALQPRGVTPSQVRGARYTANALMKPTLDPVIFNPGRPFAARAMVQTPLAGALSPDFFDRLRRQREAQR